MQVAHSIADMRYQTQTGDNYGYFTHFQVQSIIDSRGSNITFIVVTQDNCYDVVGNRS